MSTGIGLFRIVRASELVIVLFASCILPRESLSATERCKVAGNVGVLWIRGTSASMIVTSHVVPAAADVSPQSASVALG